MSEIVFAFHRKTEHKVQLDGYTSEKQDGTNTGSILLFKPVSNKSKTGRMSGFRLRLRFVLPLVYLYLFYVWSINIVINTYNRVCEFSRNIPNKFCILFCVEKKS